jgi:hypothetical protein
MSNQVVETDALNYGSMDDYGVSHAKHTVSPQEKGQAIDSFGVWHVLKSQCLQLLLCSLCNMGSGPKAVPHQEWPSGL